MPYTGPVHNDPTPCGYRAIRAGPERCRRHADVRDPAQRHLGKRRSGRCSASCSKVLKGHGQGAGRRKSARLDNSTCNLIHGFIFGRLVPDGTAPKQAYFINDAEPINMFEFVGRCWACGQRWPKMYRPCGPLMTGWQRLHFRSDSRAAARATGQSNDCGSGQLLFDR